MSSIVYDFLSVLVEKGASYGSLFESEEEVLGRVTWPVCHLGLFGFLVYGLLCFLLFVFSVSSSVSVLSGLSSARLFSSSVSEPGDAIVKRVMWPVCHLELLGFLVYVFLFFLVFSCSVLSEA